MIALYENINQKAFMGILNTDTKKFGWGKMQHDKASSLWAIKGNWQLFEKDTYDGISLKICEGKIINYTGGHYGMNDKISSAKVIPAEDCE